MKTINENIIEAYAVLDGEALDRKLIDKLAELEGSDILDLVSLANKVRCKFAPETHACTIMNAKSGSCSENCKFCSQSAHHNSEVDIYPLASNEEILNKAETVHKTGVTSFGIVTSGYGFKEIDDDFQLILDSIDLIHKKFPKMNVCASLGILSRETAEALAAKGILHYNINIQTAPSRYGELISTTHDIRDRINTIRILKELGVGVCCGGILGLGETVQDRIEMAYACKELNVDVIPLNVLIPIKGTALEAQPLTPVAEIAKSFALFRLINPEKTIKFAAGRETRMKDFQGLLMLAGVNGMLTGGYLTTRGRDTEDDNAFIKDLESFVSN